MRAAVVSLCVVVASAALAGLVSSCSSSGEGSASSAPSSKSAGFPSFTVDGTLALSGRIDLLAMAGAGTSTVGEINLASDGTCYGENEYADIKAGAQVVVADEAGKTLALGTLGGGTSPTDPTGTRTTCTFDIDVPDVPGGEKFYRVTVSSRDAEQYTEAQLKAGLTLSIGTTS